MKLSAKRAPAVTSAVVCSIALLCWLTAPKQECLAAPIITSTGGAFMPGQAVTITGSGFGTGDTDLLLWDDFEAGTLDANLNSTPKVGSWQLNNRPVATYSNDQKHGGSQSAYAWHDDSNQWSNFNVYFSPVYRLYETFWFRYDATGNGQTKVCQIHGDAGVGDFAPGVMTGGFAGDWWASYISTEEGNNGTTQRNYPDGYPARNQWHRFEIVLQESSGGGVADGLVVINIDCNQKYRQDNAVTRDYSQYHWNMAEFFTGMTNFHNPRESYIDDAYLNNSWARVEIGNASAWSTCTHKEIQIPTAWSAGSITVTVNQGSLANAASAYLYVVDQDGNVNSAGYPITVGGPPMYNLSVTNGSGDGQYEQDTVVAIAADPAPSGKAFGMWVGDSDNVADLHAASTTITMPSADVSLTAGYTWVYQLTVNSGSGDGSYTSGTVVDISADAAPSGQSFDQWTGDVANVADTLAAATTITMPPAAVEVTATYKAIAIPGDLNGDGFVGQGDLDIVLDQWGCGDPPADPITDGRADANGDGFVGQADLDIVLDHWGDGLPQQ